MVNRQQSATAKEDDLITIICQPELGYNVDELNVMSGTEVVESTMESENTLQKAAKQVVMTCGTNELKAKETLLEGVANQEVLISVTIPVAVNIKEADNGTATATCENLSIDNKRVEAAGSPIGTNIRSITADDHLKEAHSLSGQKVTGGYRGIVIVNGRKVVRK